MGHFFSGSEWRLQLFREDDGCPCYLALPCCQHWEWREAVFGILISSCWWADITTGVFTYLVATVKSVKSESIVSGRRQASGLTVSSWSAVMTAGRSRSWHQTVTERKGGRSLGHGRMGLCSLDTENSASALWLLRLGRAHSTLPPRAADTNSETLSSVSGNLAS